MSTRSLTSHFLIDLPAPSPKRRTVPVVTAPGSQPPRSAAIWTWVRAAYRRHRSRNMLAHLDGHLLKDIGVSFAEAENEANKPFWRR